MSKDMNNFIQNASRSDIITGRHADAGENSMLIQIVDFFDTFPIDYAHFPKEFYVFKEATNDYPEWLLDMKPTAKVVKKLERNYVVEKVTIK
jgi:hypothetical protein